MPQFTAQDVCDQCMLQLLFKHKCMLESNARDLCAEIYGDSSEETYSSSLSRMGKLLEELKMKIKTVKHFNDHNTYVALINQAEDEPAKLSSKYTFAEMQFFYLIVRPTFHPACFSHITCHMSLGMGNRGSTTAGKALPFMMIEQIATQEDAEEGACTMGVNEALNLNTALVSQMSQLTQDPQAAEPTRLSIAAKEEAIERLVADSWLLLDDAGELSIGPRAFLELRQYLLELNLSDTTKQVWEAAL